MASPSHRYPGKKAAGIYTPCAKHPFLTSCLSQTKLSQKTIVISTCKFSPTLKLLTVLWFLKIFKSQAKDIICAKPPMVLVEDFRLSSTLVSKPLHHLKL